MEMYTDAWVSVNAAHVKPFEPLLMGVTIILLLTVRTQ